MQRVVVADSPPSCSVVLFVAMAEVDAVDARWIPEDIEQVSDVTFTNDDEPPLTLDLFRMRCVKGRGSQPVVIWIHGGGWMSGDKDRGAERLFGLVRRGLVGVSVNYRLSQEALFPAQIHDCKCAVRFLRARANEYGIDGHRIGAWGASAGGHLASLLAATGREESLDGDRGWPSFSGGIQAACAWYAPSDFNLSDQFPPGVTPALPVMGEESAEGKLVGGAVPDRQELVALANPIRYVHKGMPPVLLMHGAKDDGVPLAASERFYEALIEHKVHAHLHVIKCGHHNAYLWGDQHLRLVEEFFEWHLREDVEST